ncbi:MAG: hypothetical protein LBO80_02395 [Treponema sp.]|jgi:hypothetical protein|nr:hypothetical protein [Treponema sp.]
MRKPVFPRIIGLFALYGFLFVLLVMIQFTRRSGFTYRVGNFVVSGHYGDVSGSGTLNPGEYALSGKLSVYSGGMEFRLAGDDDESPLKLIFDEGQDSGAPEAVYPEYMTLSGESARFRLSNGAELVFDTRYAGGAPELRISGSLGEGRALELPYRPLRSSRIQDTGEGQFIVQAGGTQYSFGHSPVNREKRLLTLDAGGIISYRAVPERRLFSPADFVIPAARNEASYLEALSRWQDQSFSLWNRTVAAGADEDTIIAYMGEAVRRGAYKAAVSAVPPSFLNGNQRTFESSVYLGQLDTALRSLVVFEREKASILSRQLNEKSADFFREPRVFAFLWTRGYATLSGAGAEMVRSIDPASLSLKMGPGILEGWQDWAQLRPGEENPFSRLIDQACFVIAGAIRMNAAGDQVFAVEENEAAIEFNLRLGTALIEYGRSADNEDWAALGRSLVLSVLSLLDESGSVPAGAAFSSRDEIGGLGTARISSARIYRMLRSGGYYPRAVDIGDAGNGVWAWTAASSVSAVQNGNVLDISVSFPVGETHYMLIRGIRPFTKVQIYNMDYRTDPQFERYDSSGWTYSASEQMLLLKMKHRTPVEHVKIFY